MRKLIGKATLILFLTLALAGCNSDSILPSDNEYSTPQDFETALIETYNVFLFGSYYGGSDTGDLNSLPEVLGDNIIRNPSGRGTKTTLYDYDFNAANAQMGIYTTAYNMIYRTNLILKFLDQSSFQESFRSKIEAEARGIRAIAHFDVVKFYGKIPTQGGELGLGILYNTSIDPPNTPSRLDLLETYNHIIEDLEFAYNHIETNQRGGRLNKEAIALYLSRVHLYLGGDENNIKASQYASEITTQPSPREDLASVFTDDSKAGVLFYISNMPGEDGMEQPIGYTWGKGSINNRSSEFNVTKSFYDMFDSSDIRKEVFMKKGEDAHGNSGIFIAKLWGKGGSHNGIVDLKILRAEEAILNKAEAEYKLNNHGVALVELDKLREVRYTDFVSGNETGDALWEAIKLERRLELAFESSRFLDIKRWGEDLSRFDEGHQQDGSGENPITLEVENSSYKFLLPFSLDAMARNPNLVQNPGY